MLLFTCVDRTSLVALATVAVCFEIVDKLDFICAKHLEGLTLMSLLALLLRASLLLGSFHLLLLASRAVSLLLAFVS